MARSRNGATRHTFLGGMRCLGTSSSNVRRRARLATEPRSRLRFDHRHLRHSSTTTSQPPEHLHLFTLYASSGVSRSHALVEMAPSKPRVSEPFDYETRSYVKNFRSNQPLHRDLLAAQVLLAHVC